VFTSVADLARKLRKYIRAYAQAARPFRWTYTVGSYLLGRHVGHCAHGGARTRQVWFRCTRFCDVGCGLRRGFSHLCQPEVQNLGASPLRDKDVGGLEVTMDDALTVSRIERVGNLDSRAAFPTPSGGCRSGALALRHPETP